MRLKCPSIKTYVNVHLLYEEFYNIILVYKSLSLNRTKTGRRLKRGIYNKGVGNFSI